MATVPYPSAATYPPQIHHHHAFPFRFSPAYAPTPIPAYAPASVPAAATHSSSPYFSAPPRFPSTYPAPTSGSCPAPTHGSPSYPYAATYPSPPPSSGYAPASVFPSPIPTQIHPNQPPPAATQIHGALHHTTFVCPILSQHHLPPTPGHLPVQAAPRPTAVPTAPNQERRPTQSHTHTSYTASDPTACRPVLPQLRCLGGDLTKGTNTSGASINDEKLVHKKPGPEILPMDNNDSNLSCQGHVLPKGNNKQHADDQLTRMEDDAKVQTAVDEQVPSKNASHHWVQRELVNVQARLDQQQAREQTAFDTLQGELAKLSSMAAQLAVSIGKQTSAATSSFVSSPSSPPGASFVEPAVIIASTTATSASMLPAAPAYVAPQVFDKMATPSSGHGTQATTPNYCDGHQTPIQSTRVPARNDNLIEHNVDGMLQAYSLHNLNRKSVFLADGTEHNYFTLPADYPLERDVPEPVCDVYDDKIEDCSNVFVDVFASTLEQQAYKEEQHADVQDCSLELQQKGDDSTCSCPVIKASNSSATRSSHLSVKHNVRELRLLWDPGASAFLVTPLINGSSNDNTGNEHVGYHLEQSPQPISYSAMEHVGVMAPPSVAAQAAGLVSVCCSKTNNTAGYETMHVLDMQPPIAVQDDHKVLSEMHVSEVFEKEKQESEDLDKCLHKASDNAFSEQLPKYFSKPIFSLEGPTTGAFSFTNEKKSDNKLLAVCFNNTSDNAFSEEAKDFTYLHGLAERFIKLTHKKSTQVVSILCVQEASMHCDDERFEYQLPLRSAPCIWDPGINSFSYKKLHIFPWIPSSAIIILQQVHNKNISSLLEFSLEKGRHVQWDPGIKLLLCELLWLQTMTKETEYALRHLLALKIGTHDSTYSMDTTTTICSPTNLIQQGRNLGAVLHFCLSIFNDMHCCRSFQKCNSTSSQLLWNKNIKCYGVALWLIHFQPP